MRYEQYLRRACRRTRVGLKTQTKALISSCTNLQPAKHFQIPSTKEKLTCLSKPRIIAN
jgi:hypothetical protein